MRITSKGQVTIPLEVREQLGLLPHTEVDIVIDGDAARIVKSTAEKDTSRGSAVLQSIRKGGKPSLSTEEIMRLTRGE